MKQLKGTKPDINIMGRVPVPFSKQKINSIVLKILKTASIEASAIGLSFVSKDRMKTLNNKYRNLDKPTDVLSFLYNQDKKTGIEGDIVICPSYVKDDIKNTETLFSAQIKRLLIHAILHLSGMDHKTATEAKRMFSKQERLLKNL